jgi:hypothetical protein
MSVELGDRGEVNANPVVGSVLCTGSPALARTRPGVPMGRKA